MLQKGQFRPDNNRQQRLPESPEGAVVSWSLKVAEMSCLENTISVSAKFHTPR